MPTRVPSYPPPCCTIRRRAFRLLSSGSLAESCGVAGRKPKTKVVLSLLYGDVGSGLMRAMPLMGAISGKVRPWIRNSASKNICSRLPSANAQLRQPSIQLQQRPIATWLANGANWRPKAPKHFLPVGYYESRQSPPAHAHPAQSEFSLQTGIDNAHMAWGVDVPIASRTNRRSGPRMGLNQAAAP